MANLYITVFSTTIWDTARSTFAGVIQFIASQYNGQPNVQCIYDYGTPNNSAATPFPVFTGDTDAIAFFTSSATTSLISTLNTAIGSAYYTSYTLNTIDAPVLADFSALATVAKTGSYTDLTSTPAIPPAQVNSDWSASSGLAQILNKPSLATVATTGAYSDLSGRPTLATVATSGAYSDLTGKPSLAAVATSGSYTDLTNKPTIPTVQTYEGTTQRLNSFAIFQHATVASGVAVFQLTTDGTSSGAALFPNGVIQDSVNVFVSDSAASYQMSVGWSNSNKTLTVTTNKLTTANILTGLLGQAAANGAVVKLQVFGY